MWPWPWTSRIIPYEYKIFVGGVSIFSCGRDVNYYFQRAGYNRLYAKMATKIPKTPFCIPLSNVTLLLLPTGDGVYFPQPMKVGRPTITGAPNPIQQENLCFLPFGMLPWDCHEEAQFSQLGSKRQRGGEMSCPNQTSRQQPVANVNCQYVRGPRTLSSPGWEADCSHMSEPQRDQQKEHPAEPNLNYLLTRGEKNDCCFGWLLT